MELTVTGSLIQKGDVQHVTEKFRKREFVLDISEDVNGKRYDNYAKLQLVQAKCDILDRYEIGDNITVSFNIKGNRWERDGKVNYITNLDAWRIVPATGETPQPAANSAYIAFEEETRSADDLPF